MTAQGALFELVARGQKDRYFVREEDSKFVYDASYGASQPHLAERRTAVPVNGSAFGGTFDVEIDAYGDVLTECALEVELPTWLPPLPLTAGGTPVAPDVANGLCDVRAVGGAQYGYVRGVGWFLFDRIQLYQDQFMIQEWSGDGLYVKALLEESEDLGELRMRRGGATATGTVARRATPGRLRIDLPLVGVGRRDVGLPLVGMPWQTLRLRVTLRKLEQLVVCSDDTVMSPAPWAVPLFQSTGVDGSVYEFAPLSIAEMGQPTVLLATTQRYVLPEAQQAIRESAMEIPFRRMFENRFTFGELDYISLDKGGVSAVTRRLEGRHPTERLMWFFRTQEAVDRNRLDDFVNPYFNSAAGGSGTVTDTQPLTWPYGSFVYRMKLLVAGRDREVLHDAGVWELLAPWAKAERAPLGAKGVGMMSWGLGDVWGARYPVERQPTGTVNLTTADRPTLYLELANVPVHPVLAQRKVEFRVFSEAWNVYDVVEGRGRVRFAS